MGRRAKKAPVQTKKRPTLAKRFKCPFCANDAVVECKMDFKNGVGSLECRLCGASYQMPIHSLHEPVDVFSEWLDDCEAAQQGRTTGTAGEAQHQYEEDDDDDDDELPGASGLARRARDDEAVEAPARKPAASASTGGGSGTAVAQRPSYSALGLEDSDSDDEDDE